MASPESLDWPEADSGQGTLNFMIVTGDRGHPAGPPCPPVLLLAVIRPADGKI